MHDLLNKERREKREKKMLMLISYAHVLVLSRNAVKIVATSFILARTVGPRPCTVILKMG